jgi:hypothetical protein
MKVISNYKGFRIDQTYGNEYSSLPATFVVMRLRNPRDESNDPDVSEQLSTEFSDVDSAKRYIDKLPPIV